MGLSKISFFNLLMTIFSFFIYSEESLLPTTQNYYDSPNNQTMHNHILYLMHAGKIDQALETYQLYQSQRGYHDFDVIERIGLTLLNQGYQTRDVETQLMTLFGAGISTNEKTLYILEEALKNDQPQLQLVAINFLAKYHNDSADESLHRVMGSNYLLIRLEAALQLAKKKDSKAVGQIEALMTKVDESLWPIFPQLYAEIGTPQAKTILRRLLTNPNEMVRIASILSIAENNHDDFLPVVRRLSTHHEPAQQETCAVALGCLKDESSKLRLTELSTSQNPFVRLGALTSLHKLGDLSAKNQIEILAKNGNLFAITALGKIKGSETLLASLLSHENIHVKANAARSLLKHADNRCLPFITELVLQDARDLALQKNSSPGKSLIAWKVIPSAKQNFQDNPIATELSLSVREELLLEAVELPENDFLSLANAIFESKQNDLIPALVSILENHQTPPVIALLKKHHQKMGAPLIRNYCNLALYRLKQEGPYSAILLEWVKQQKDVDLIRFRPMLSWDLRDDPNNGSALTPQETSRLLIETFESFVEAQDDKGVDLLISIIKSGNPKNKYALIGLLMRAIQ